MKFCSKREEKAIIVHDCLISDVKTQDGKLIIGFDDGIWALPETKYNPGKETVHTRRAEMVIHGFDTEGYMHPSEMSNAEVFEEHYMFAKYQFTTVRTLSIAEWFEDVNKYPEKYEVYDLMFTENSHGIRLSGRIHSKWKPFGKLQWKYAVFFHLYKDSDISYHWDELDEDRVW